MRGYIFLPDSQLELSLARFLSEELAMQLTEGTPYVHRAIIDPELRASPPISALWRGRTSMCSWPAWSVQPDPRFVASLANPLEAEGLRTKWAIELVFTPIQGYEQAGDLELLPAPAAQGPLGGARMKLTLWSYEGPPCVGAMRVAASLKDIHYVPTRSG